MAAKKATGKAVASPRQRTSRRAKTESVGFDPRQCVGTDAASKVGSLSERVESEGGAIVGAYVDPYGGHPLLVAVLPIGRVEATPFQRDLSEAHQKRLAEVIGRTQYFLDPIVVVTAPQNGFWTPNGRHRLEAMRRLGAKAITALVVPDRAIARQILALNTEKAHNLKDRSLEVIRIYRDLLAEDPTSVESTFAFYLEDPALVTLGVCYEVQPRFAGGAYHPVLRRTERFMDAPLGTEIRTHEALAGEVLNLEEHVAAAVAKLKARGLTSPYLRSFVVSRINPLRWLKGEPPPARSVVEQMRERAAKFNADRVKQEDLARAGGVPDEDA